MSIQLLNISIPTIFKRYSKLYNIYRNLHSIDLFGLEIRNFDKDLANSLKDRFLDGKEICYTKPTSNNKFLDFLAIGTYSSIKEIAKDKISLIDEGLGHQVYRIICNYSDYKIGTFKVGNKELFLNKSYVMGILNVTPDSFSDGGKFTDANRAIKHGLDMLKNGADIIDIGGESTRPGSNPVDSVEEIKRVAPVIHGILNEIPDAIISIDTNKAVVADEAVSVGAKIVNDISAGTFDEEMFDVVKKTDTAIILMHIKGTPKNMQRSPLYSDVVNEVYDYLNSRVIAAKSKGITNIIVDPGIGFGKSVSDNYEIIRRLDEFRAIGHPILVGLSKKSFIGKSLNLDVDERENATVVAESIAIKKGARFIRTHDVVKAVQAREMLKFMNNPDIANNV